MSLSDIRKKNNKKSLLEVRTISGEYPKDLRGLGWNSRDFSHEMNNPNNYKLPYIL